MMKRVDANSTVRTLIPAETDKILSFQVNKVAFNAANILAMVRFTPNGTFDVDPTLGSTTTPGFTEWAAFYNYYRVIKVAYDIEVANNETFPLRVYTILTNTDPGTIGNPQFSGNPLAKTALISGKGGMDRCRLRDLKQVSQVVGSQAPETEDNFRAAVTTNPVDVIHLGIGCFNPGSAFVPNGVAVVGVIRMFIRFYDPKTLFL